MKWISRTVLVARPVTLYVRDVPILWLPFIFQDMRPGRHSGILMPAVRHQRPDPAHAAATTAR